MLKALGYAFSRVHSSGNEDLGTHAQSSTLVHLVQRVTTRGLLLQIGPGRALFVIDLRQNLSKNTKTEFAGQIPAFGKVSADFHDCLPPTFVIGHSVTTLPTEAYSRRNRPMILPSEVHST